MTRESHPIEPGTGQTQDLTHQTEKYVKIQVGAAKGFWTFLSVLAFCLMQAAPALTASSENSPSTDKPVVEQVLDLLREKGDISDEQYDDMLTKAREEEATRPAASTEEKALPAVAAEKPRAKVTANYKGLGVSSPDGRFKIQVGGRVQADWNVFQQDITPLGDGMELRRARLKTQGTLYKDFKFKLEVNFDPGGKVEVTDGWLSYQGLKPMGLPLILTVGHQKVPFSQQSMTSSNWQVFQERSMQDAFIDNPAMGRRRLGFVARTYGTHWLADAGVFAEGTRKPDEDNDNFGAAGRLLFYPLIEERRLLILGGAVYYRSWNRNPASGEDLKFGARPEGHIAGEKLINTGWMNPMNDTIMYNGQVSGVLGSFHAQAEYTGVRVSRTGEENVFFNGWYVQAGYFLTGENRVYDRKSGKYKRPVPKSMVGDGGWGAWELAARYSQMNLADGNIQGGKERNVTVGLNWWMNRSFLIRVNYVRANTDPTSSEDPTMRGAGQDQTINVFEGRFQVVF